MPFLALFCVGPCLEYDKYSVAHSMNSLTIGICWVDSFFAHWIVATTRTSNVRGERGKYGPAHVPERVMTYDIHRSALSVPQVQRKASFPLAGFHILIPPVIQSSQMTSNPGSIQVATPNRFSKMPANQATNLNHLLNFTLPPRQTRPLSSLPRRSRKVGNVQGVWNKERE